MAFKFRNRSVADPAVQQNFEQLEQLLPSAGDLKSTMATSAPKGWLLAQGQTLNRSDYPELAMAMGVVGATFTLPDLQGRAPIGAGSGAGLTPRTLGATGGSEPSNMPSHSHKWSEQGFGLAIFNAALTAGGTGTYQRGGTPGTLTVTDSVGGGADNMMPWVAVNWLIKT